MTTHTISPGLGNMHSLQLSHLCMFFFFLFVAYGSSWARGQLSAAAASLHHSNSNTGSELHLQCIPQLEAMPDS